MPDVAADIILASGSSARRMLLENAGVQVRVVPASIDEREAEAPMLANGALPSEVAMALAVAKAVAVSKENPGALVIGGDQTLDFDGKRWTKPASASEAREQLARLSGRAHKLQSAVALARDGAVVWQHVESAVLTMRPLTAAYIDSYLARLGPEVLVSVGTYQLEGEGIRLFDHIDGDYFTVLGLPLLPLLKALRAEGAIE